jgi:hypothetical protein
MKTIQLVTLILVGLLTQNTLAQKLSGVILNKETQLPISYVNIGIPNKNSGTVSNADGKFELIIDEKNSKDSLKFSCIGYESKTINIQELLTNKLEKIELNEKITEIKEITVLPKEYKKKTLGVKSEFKMMAAGFAENKLGYELGILMKTKKTMILKKIHMNFAICSYDSIFYRLNIYEETGNMQFKNIMPEPYYLSLSVKDLKSTTSIDISHLNIISDKNLLVTLEHIKNLGEGRLYFCATPTKKTIYRKTSQGAWEKGPVGISISAEAMVEK